MTEYVYNEGNVLRMLVFCDKMRHQQLTSIKSTSIQRGAFVNYITDQGT